MEFVKATKEESEEILAMYRSAIGTEGCTWTLDYPNEKDMEGDLERGDLFCLKDKGTIIGAVSVDLDMSVERLSCWDTNLQPAAELARLVVRKEYRNQGIARLLLQEGMNELRRRGKKSVHFLVSKGNQRALRSYDKLVFQNKGECFLYDGEWWCYEKEL